MWTLMADGEATEAIGVVADIKRESKFSDSPKTPISTNLEAQKIKLYKGAHGKKAWQKSSTLNNLLFETQNCCR